MVRRLSLLGLFCAAVFPASECAETSLFNPVTASSVLGTDDTSTSVRFTLPVATKLVENASSTGHRFLYSVESTIPPKSVGGMVPVATPQKEESSRKPRAAWGQGIIFAGNCATSKCFSIGDPCGGSKESVAYTMS